MKDTRTIIHLFLLTFFVFSFLQAGAQSAPNINTSENFPDPNFRAAVEELMGVGPGGEFTADAAATKRFLDCSGRNIADMTGIEFFTRIWSLDCHANQLTHLDVSKNTELNWLLCGSNQLTELDVSGNPDLTSLLCFSNQLTALDVSGNPELTSLLCDFNQITHLDLSHNSKLHTLSCESNQLTSLDVSANSQLKSLTCAANQLTSLDISNLDLLDTIRCQSNQLTDISSFVANTALGSGDLLDLRNNNLDCNDWHHIVVLRNRLGEPAFSDSGILKSGVAYSPQNGLDPFDCGSNSAPVLDVSGAPFLADIDENIPDNLNTGTPVSAIIATLGGAGITDADGDPPGLAVTAVNGTNGTWQYALTNGHSWVDFGAVSASASRLLTPEAIIRFVPDAHFNGTVSPGISFRAWDQSSGTNGGTADTTVNGGTTAFSAATETADITINPAILMAMTVVFTDTAGNSISNVGVGRMFRIYVYAQDLRTTGDNMGVLSAFADVIYNSNVVDVTGIVHIFNEFATGEIDDVNGEIDEAGGLDSGPVSSRDPQPVFYLEAKATGVGTLTVILNAGDDPDFSENVLFGIDGDRRRNTSYISNSIVIGRPDLVATAFEADPDHALLGQTSLTFVVENVGDAGAGTFMINLIHSNDEIIGNNDDVILTTQSYGGLEAGTSLTESVTGLQVDVSTLYARALGDDPPGQPLNHRSASVDFLGIVVDPGNQVDDERDETNNFNQGKGLDKDDITFFPWDVNDSGAITPTDAGFIINRLGLFVPDQADPRADVDGNGAVTPTDAGATINRIGYLINDSVFEGSSSRSARSGGGRSASGVYDQDMIDLVIAFTDRHGNAVGELDVGDEFRIHLRVRDMREGQAAAGVLSAFADILYDPALIEITSLTSTFDDFATGDIDNLNGVVNEAGGLENGSAVAGDYQTLLYLDAVATRPGLASIVPRAGDSAYSENTLYGIDDDLRHVTRYGRGDIIIRPGDLSTTDDVADGNLSFDLTLNSNWNLISIPIVLSESGLQKILDQTKSGIVWSIIDGRLQETSQLFPGHAYWAFIDGDPRTVTVAGKPVIDDTVTLSDGWNLVGSIARPPYDPASLPLDPAKFIGSDGLIPPILTWDGTDYIAASELVPGRGYFIFVGEPSGSE